MRRHTVLLGLTAVLLVIAAPVFSDTVSSDTAGSASLVSVMAEGLREAYREDPELSIGARSCVVDNFTWAESGIGTAFSDYLRSAMEDALMRVDEFDLVIRPEDAAYFGEKARNLLEGKQGTTSSLPMSTYRIFGTYEVSGGKARLDVKIFSEVFSRLMADFPLSMELEEIPRGVELYPPNRDVVTDVSSELSDLYSGDDDFQVFVSTNRGEGGVFTEGEFLKLYLLSSRDCYLKIYHIDVHGRTALIFQTGMRRTTSFPVERCLSSLVRDRPFSSGSSLPTGPR
ncbi:MAG: hypothetical protein SVR04_12660 [Spirochaetota bacterium]|nr:hypothetical protein [Spirochaetota bacterium]